MLRKYKIKEKKYLVFIVLIIAAEVATSLLPPQILRMIIDNHIMTGEYNGLLVMGLLYFAAFAAGGAADFFSGWVLTIVGQKIVRRVRSAMDRKIAKLGAGYFTSHSQGEITSKFMVDVDNVNTLFTDGIVSMAIDSFTIIGIIISIWIFSWQLGVFALCLVPIVVLLTRFFQKRMLKCQKANLEELSKVNSHISESIKNMVMVKTFSREPYMKSRYRRFLADNYNTMDKVNYYDSCYSPVIQVIAAASTGLLFYMASGGSSNSLGISIGEIAASVNLLASLFSPIDSLGMELQSIQTGISGIHSVSEFLDLPEEEPKSEFAELDEAVKTGRVSFVYDNVTFGYDADRDVIKAFSETVRPGENVVFAGRTGAGKSTLLKLTAGLIAPDEGAVRVNGIDISKVSPKQKRRLFGYVEQDFSFVTGSVKTQISLGDPGITEDEIRRALRFVDLEEYVNELPQGIDTVVKPQMFSQGQRQLLAIARAIAADPPALLLDEVTANLDTVTEERVVDVLKRAEEGKTIISIAHRQSTIMSAERIIRIGGQNEL